jgi:hypothetical protein
VGDLSQTRVFVSFASFPRNASRKAQLYRVSASTITRNPEPAVSAMAIYAIRKNYKHQKIDAHALPCKIYHNGSVDARKRWKPERSEDGTTLTNHFRGRKLHGRMIKLPENYEGILVSVPVFTDVLTTQRPHPLPHREACNDHRHGTQCNNDR